MAPSVSILTGFDRKYNETHDIIFELDKIWGREEDHKKGNYKVSPSLQSPSMFPYVAGYYLFNNCVKIVKM